MAVKKAFFLFNLKPGLKVEDYMEWTVRVNHPGAARLNSIVEFHDYVTRSAMRDKPIAYQFVEEVTITDFDAYVQELSNPARADEAKAWRDWVQEDYVILLTDIIK